MTETRFTKGSEKIKSPRPCYSCGEDFEISLPALKKRNFICAPCRKIQNKKNLDRRRENGLKVSGTRMSREYHSAYDKEYKNRPEVRKRKREQFRERMKSESEQIKMKSRQITRNAIRRGELIKQPCEVCGAEKVDAHHDDYDKPLDIRWLCRIHHVEVHMKARGES